MKRLLILSSNYTSDKVAGIAIRFVEMAKTLSKDLKVTLALANSEGFKADGFEIASFKNDADILSLFKTHDVVLSRGLNIVRSGKLNKYDIPMIFDLLCPFFFEGLEADKDSAVQFNSSIKENIKLIEGLAKRGDFFVCANEDQRDFWLSALYGQKRITLDLYRQDPSLKDLIDIVPFGLPDEKPIHKKKVLKGVIEGVKDTDKVITWFGGMWDWLDPLSPVYAIKNICKKRDDVKLFFIGIKHPDPKAKPHNIYHKVMEEANNSGLINKNIFFIDWVPYEGRADYLLESDIGIMAHNDNLETKFSWRTRILDYIWAKLPTIMTKGDPMSNIVDRNGLGLTVNYNDPTDIERAILKIADDEKLANEMKKNIDIFAQKLKWDKVVEPIIKFCSAPKRTSK